MSQFDKLIKKILNGKNVSYDEGELVLLKLGFDLNIRGSHHSFRKSGYKNVVTLKKRSLLISYQIDKLQEVLKDHGY